MVGVQIAGRGRLERSWGSPGSNFMGTLLSRVGSDFAQICFLSLAVGLCVRDVLERALPGRADIKAKWPNDVYVGTAKIAGILIETHKAPGEIYWAASGIGVNLAQGPQLAKARPTAAVADYADDINVDDFLALLDDAMTTMLEAWPPASAAAFVEVWAAHAYGIGEEVRLHDRQTGRFIGIDPRGAARVALDSGDETIVHAGDLAFKQLEEAAHAAGN